MFVARLICSDEACAEERVAEVETLEELDALACDCGCTWQVLGWPDPVEEVAGTVVAFPVPSRGPQRLAS